MGSSRKASCTVCSCKLKLSHSFAFSSVCVLTGVKPNYWESPFFLAKRENTGRLQNHSLSTDIRTLPALHEVTRIKGGLRKACTLHFLSVTTWVCTQLCTTGSKSLSLSFALSRAPQTIFLTSPKILML